MTFRIADTFSASLTKLSPQEQKVAKTAAFDLQMNPETPGFSLHRVDRARDPDFWTARVNRDIRLVLHKRGGDTLLAYVAHHDDAYHWAETRRIDTHPRTGAAQIVEIRETVEEVVIQRYVEESIRLPRLFGGEPDETLLSWGVPEDWLDTVRDATEETVLDIAGHLPGEAAEALLQAATGARPEPAPFATDPYAHPDAARRFRVMADQAELAAALDAPWEQWTVFLHPAQREFVERDFNGPARVIGSAGTGKTVVALHRAVRLARADPEARVLLTTFNAHLAEGLSHKVDLLAHNDVRQRIEVSGLSDALRGLYEETFGKLRIATLVEVDAALDEALAAAEIDVDADFLRDEWRLIVDAWHVESPEVYRELPRLGRKVRMAAARRDALWEVFAATRRHLAQAGLVTDADMAHRLAELFAQTPDRPFSHVVVDEAQDISVPELHVLAALAGDRPNGLFFAGDIGQRIFRAPFPWTRAGVEIQGRSRSLKVNYRTSEQIRRRSDALLPESITEADGNEDRRSGVVSLFQGPVPELRIFETEAAEADGVVQWLNAREQEGFKAQEIAVLVRSNGQFDQAEAAIGNSRFVGQPIHLLRMHDAKGAEYRAVAIMSCDEGVLPLDERLKEARDEGMLAEIMATERHLLYVAATRARERLWISGAGRASEFLHDLM